MSSADPLERQRALLREVERRRHLLYRPYPKQRAFHAAGRTHRQRLFMAGNQLGKTLAGGYEISVHATGEYPKWWEGARFDRPCMIWIASESDELTRDNPQRMLFGRPREWGSGMIPERCFESDPVKARGIPDLIEYAKIKHVSGGLSTIVTKSYEQGRQKWQGETIDIIWDDEEPPWPIFDEGLTRLNAGGPMNPDGTRSGGLLILTATPLLGMTEVIQLFYPEPTTAQRACFQMEIDEVDHYTPAQKAEIVANYMPYQREARARGIPVLGSGRVFPVTEASITWHEMPERVPKHWRAINGIDFGYDHPTAGARCYFDPDSPCFYVADVYAQSEALISTNASALRRFGNVPFAWPHDGERRDPSSGVTLRDLYVKEGLRMLPNHAQSENGSISLEGSIQEMLLWMARGQFKVASHLERFFREFRLYHRKDGEIVKQNDDVISAVRYAFVMRRFAVETAPRRIDNTLPVYDPFRPEQAEPTDPYWWPDKEGYTQ